MKKFVVLLVLFLLSHAAVAMAAEYDLVVKNSRVMDPETNYSSPVDFGGGVSGSQPHIKSSADIALCEDPRPEVCTMDYDPVCGVLAEGTFKTYSNGCSACSDHNVVSYTQSECK